MATHVWRHKASELQLQLLKNDEESGKAKKLKLKVL